MATQSITEEWRTVIGWNNYVVSNLGRVFSTLNRRMLKTHISEGQYMRVGLSQDGKFKNCKVHRLVAEAFLLPDGDRKHVDHINGVKTDNRPVNLRWVTQKENNRASFARLGGIPGARGVLNQNTILNDQQTRLCHELKRGGYVNGCRKELSRLWGVPYKIVQTPRKAEYATATKGPHE